MWTEWESATRVGKRSHPMSRNATRYDKTTASFASFFSVAVAMMMLAGWT